MPATITVVGTGYVGLTIGAYLAHLGHTVVCADVVAEKVAQLNRGELPIVEAGLDELVAEGLAAQRLSFVLGAADAVADAEFVFLCVPTPQGEDGSADLSYVRQAAGDIAARLSPECIVINKSTVPVGSTRVVEEAIGRDDIFVVSNPEFLREGSAVHDCLHPDRIVIGSDDQAVAMRVAGLFESLRAPLVITDPASAETIKYASNAFLATKVSFVNALANVCEAVGADVGEVVLGMGHDRRIGFEFLKPGPGWGGSCFHPDETVLAAHDGNIRLLRFEDLFADVERLGAKGWSILSWRAGETTPEFLPVASFTARPWDGDLVEVRTKMGRRITTTPDHPFVIGDGMTPQPVEVRTAEELTSDDWLPIAQNFPVLVDDRADAVDLLAASWFHRELGGNCYEKRIPDLAWSAPESWKWELLRGLWDGDGSWSLIAGGPSVVLEYGTVSRALADGMLRLLGDLNITARLKVGRTRRSTVDTYWLLVSGADQVEDALWLLPPEERVQIRRSLAGQAKRIASTGYRKLSKNASWVRVTEAERRSYQGLVYSVEVPGTATIVATHGLVAHNCFPKDTRAMVHIAEDAGYDFGLLRGVIAVNDEQYERMADKVERMVGGSVDGRCVAAWGLTFKARTDDLRDSPAIEVIRRLQDRGAVVRAYDPTVKASGATEHASLSGIELGFDPYSVCQGAGVAVVLTEWDELRWLDFAKVAELMVEPRIVDTRNLLDAPALRRLGFAYSGVGRVG